ncbi:MAG TPA: CRISPR system precrRNA processing endoribonuclease RAMP protein Cas6 [Malonomonas sp.]
MSDLFPLPAALQRVEYAQLYFHLEVSDYFDLPPLGLLQLRRELLQALRQLRETSEVVVAAQLDSLLQPDFPVDPVLRRIVQKPSPALVLSPDPADYGLIEPKQRLVLPVMFLGAGLQGIAAFRQLLVTLGQQGLYAGTGQFCLEGIEAADNSGLRAMLWVSGEPEAELTPPINDLYWWLQRRTVYSEQLRLEVQTPLRLLRQNRPLFKADFSELFPFILRRVTAMLASHCGVELVADPVGLITQATQVEVVSNQLRWQDWRRLDAAGGGQDLGGLLGSLELRGPALADLQWLLQIGSLLNIGKGAAYGAGRYRLQNP